MTGIADTLNGMPPRERGDALIRCCGSRAWAEAMQRRTPFRDNAHARQAAEEIWNGLNEQDWLEALAAHPRIGDVASLRAKYASTQDWAAGEQSGVDGASDATLHRLAEQNTAYEARFGHLFVVCATGKTADEMLALLEQRIDNRPEEELRIAAAEQLKITLLRLEKLAR